MTNPSRSLLNGRAADCGGSLRVDRADNREKRISDSRFTEASVPTQSAAPVSPRRIASSPSWIAVPPEAQAVEVAIGEPISAEARGERLGDRAEQETLIVAVEIAGRGGAQQVGVGRPGRRRMPRRRPGAAAIPSPPGRAPGTAGPERRPDCRCRQRSRLPRSPARPSLRPGRRRTAPATARSPLCRQPSCAARRRRTG